MYRDKTIIRLRKDESPWRGTRTCWNLKRGKRNRWMHVGISRLLRRVSTFIQDKDKVYSIDVVIKRRR